MIYLVCILIGIILILASFLAFLYFYSGEILLECLLALANADKYKEKK